MKKSMTIEKTMLLAAMVTAALFVPISDAAQPNVEADSLSVAEIEGNISFANPGTGSATVTMAAKSSPMTMPATGRIVADENSSAGAFAGNYTSAYIRELELKITAEYTMEKAADISLVLYGASGRIWQNDNIQIPTQDGDSLTVNKLLLRAAGWDYNGIGDKDAMWAEDLENVVYVGVNVSQIGNEQQIYKISNLKLLDAETSALAERIQAYFSSTEVELTDEDKQGDDDGDGMNNWDELLAGTDPGNANSLFAADLDEEQPAVGVTLSWPCAEGASYSVLRADDMNFNFNVRAFGLIPSTDELNAGVMSYTDDTATGDGPYFFKIVKE